MIQFISRLRFEREIFLPKNQTMPKARALDSDEPAPQEDEFSKNELEAVTAVFR